MGQDEAHRLAATIRKIIRSVIRQEQVARVVYGTVSNPVTSPNHSVTFTQAVPTGVTPVGRPGIKYLASYTPTAGDTVAAIAVAGDMFVIGKLA